MRWACLFPASWAAASLKLLRAALMSVYPMGTAMLRSSQGATSLTSSEKASILSLSSGNWVLISSERARAVSTAASSLPARFMEALWSTRMPNTTSVLWMAS